MLAIVMNPSPDPAAGAAHPTSQPGDRGVRVVFTTFPTLEVARQVGTQLVDRRLVACVNLIPSIESIYRWQGAVEQDREVLAVCKTAGDRLDELRRALLELHPYDVPELLVLEVTDGAPDYLAWVLAETRGAAEPTG